MIKDSEFLREVKSKISSPANWSRRYYALDKDGNCVLSTSHTACKWCLMGACHAVYRFRVNELRTATKMLYVVSHDLFDTYSTDVNDTLGFEAVHEVLDEAIRRFEQQENS